MQTQIERLTADNAAMREALRSTRGETTYQQVVIDSILAQTHPGAKLLEELAALREMKRANDLYDKMVHGPLVAEIAALRKVAEAAWLAAEVIDPRIFVLNTGKFYREELMSALTALDALNTQEAPNAPTK